MEQGPDALKAGLHKRIKAGLIISATYRQALLHSATVPVDMILHGLCALSSFHGSLVEAMARDNCHECGWPEMFPTAHPDLVALECHPVDHLLPPKNHLSKGRVVKELVMCELKLCHPLHPQFGLLAACKWKSGTLMGHLDILVLREDGRWCVIKEQIKGRLWRSVNERCDTCCWYPVTAVGGLWDQIFSKKKKKKIGKLHTSAFSSQHQFFDAS